jgi:DnaJ domain
MNPYKILGVARGCTHDEVREAFRFKVRQVHPDHGGDDTSFVQLRAAYKQILEDLDRYPGLSVKRPIRASRDQRAPTPPDPSVGPKAFRDFVSHLSAKRRMRYRPWQLKCLRIIGTVLFLSVFVGLIWVNWIAWTWDHDKEEARARRQELEKSAGESDSNPIRTLFDGSGTKTKRLGLAGSNCKSLPAKVTANPSASVFDEFGSLSLVP